MCALTVPLPKPNMQIQAEKQLIPNPAKFTVVTYFLTEL